MENDRWSLFGWGVALGLLIGGGLVAGYCVPRLLEAQEKTARLQAEINAALDVHARALAELEKAMEEQRKAEDERHKAEDALHKAKVVKPSTPPKDR
jgi:hypothetical protein